MEPPVCGEQALADINKLNCTLYVPEEGLDAYKAAPQWQEFMNIDAIQESGIDNPMIDEDEKVTIFDLNGVRIYDGYYKEARIPAGIYFVRKSNGQTYKIAIR